MSARTEGARRRRRAWTLAALVAAASVLPACDGDANVSVGVGVAVPAPWGVATVSTAVPFGPYYGGRYGPMW
jgi:CO/xanthine dehydrogenase FAD-binding subunit